MCGRFTLLTLGQFTDLFPWIRMPAAPMHNSPVLRRFNIAPSQNIAVVANDGQNQIDFYRWGLVPAWAKDASIGNRMINARMETLAEKPAFRGALRVRRCLIPADGFFEWKPVPSGTKIPMRIRLKSHQPFAFAGLWERWRATDGSEVRSCTIITGPANDLLRPIHDRMPMILASEHYKNWIEPAEMQPPELLRMLTPYPAAEMEAYAVSTRVNNASAETSDCVEPVGTNQLLTTDPGLFD